MLTPVALALAGELDLPALPFAFATVWLSNAASLLLPISNLSNLLAVERTEQHPGAFVADMWLPQLVVLVVVLGNSSAARYRQAISGRYVVPGGVLPYDDRLLVVASSVIAFAIAIATVLGVPAWAAASLGLVLLVLLCVVRARDLVATARLARLVPARIVVGAFGLFVLVELMLEITSPGKVHWSNDLSLAAAAAALSNLVNNLPAWLALASGHRRGALPGAAGGRQRRRNAAAVGISGQSVVAAALHSSGPARQRGSVRPRRTARSPTRGPARSTAG